ncbi:hypothetical protein AGRA3207_000557 [Actinomadura graeca]|uniref:Secreted protein n=1 Tax=Actinomadura graeca TaxID=2750812 RepID=A0ABX8QQB6_9ACTN|nr:hypothetical protein [Actinomadura graeca]QXJ19942.1 hypothetical protein AGRA3207_000557 [Actinomadura graeca]
MKIKTRISAAAAAGLLAVAFAPNLADAATGPTPGAGSDTLPGKPGGAGGDSSAFAGIDVKSGQAVLAAVKNVNAPVVGCVVRADDPDTLIYNKPPIIAQGEIVRCTVPKPDDCRVETDLEEYFTFEGVWSVVANGSVKRGCNIGRASRSTASYKCSHDAHGSHKYRTKTWLTVTYRGQNATNAATSGEKSWWCF